MTRFNKPLIALFVLCLALFLASCSQKSIWTKKELAILSSLQLKNLKPASSVASNQFAENPLAARFGKSLFFDARFSANGQMSCASCHQADKAFTDGLAKAKGMHRVGRNTPTILGAPYSTWFYWDGRKDSLWSQALIPFEALDEMGFSRVAVLRLVGQGQAYRAQYESLFGKFPQEVLSPTFPNQAGPYGDAKTKDNWYRLPAASKKLVNQAYANIGKAIAAYERTLPLPQTRFDHYLASIFKEDSAGQHIQLSEQEIQGFKLFADENKTHCLRCHNGPMFTNQQFHNIETGNFDGTALDFGRLLGVQAVLQDEFNCLGEYSDAPKQACTALRFLSKDMHGDSKGAFKTPTLRYLNKTGPYFHDGRFESLDEVLDHYLSIKQQTPDLTVIKLTEAEKKSLIAFLNMLNNPQD